MKENLVRTMSKSKDRRVVSWSKGNLVGFNKFLIETQKKLKEENGNEIEILSKFLKESSKFQDENLETIKKFEKKLTKSPKLYNAIMFLKDSLIVCGRDHIKTESHFSKVSNRTETEFDSKTFYLEVDDFYKEPQPLVYLDYLKNTPGIISKKKQMAAGETATTFLLDNITKMMNAIADIR